MNDINNEESIRQVLQAIYKPVVASSTFKDELRKQLRDEVAAKAKEVAVPVWKRQRLWVPIAVVLVVASIGYGIWLPFTSASTIVPPETPSSVTPPVTSPPIAVSTGTLEIRITDAPAEREVSAINVTVANIEVHQAGEGDDWITVLEGSEDFELLELIGVVEELVSEELPIGHYTQIRMDMPSVEATIDGEPEPAEVKLPSGKLKIIVPFDIKEDRITVITIDFDAEKSLVFTGGSKVLFKPVVKLIVIYEDGNSQP